MAILAVQYSHHGFFSNTRYGLLLGPEMWKLGSVVNILDCVQLVTVGGLVFFQYVCRIIRHTQ